MLLQHCWPLCAQFHFFAGQVFDPADLAIIALLILLEGVLSIDNALVLGLLAKRLPETSRSRALSYGLIGAFLFRLLAICTATFLLKWTFVKFLGGGYLVYIAVKHLVFESTEQTPDHLVIDAAGRPTLVDALTGQPLSPEREELEIESRLPFDLSPSDLPSLQLSTDLSTAILVRQFWWTVFVIEMTDIAFAVDSILAAIGVVGGPPPGTPANALHPKLWVVILGGFLGVVLMRFAAVLFIKLLDRFPRFEIAAYVLVFVIGAKLLLDWAFNSDWSTFGWSFNVDWAHSYVGWLQENWLFKLPAESIEHPHLIDFHDLRRPECMLFWLTMLAAFCIGFLPRRNRSAHA